MSNSSSARASQDAWSRALPDAAPARAVLEALSAEWAELAGEIKALGDRFSGAPAKGLSGEQVMAMQQFDALNQRMEACARVLSATAGLMRQGGAASTLADCIAAMPTERARTRLMEALGAQDAADSRVAESEVDWF